MASGGAPASACAEACSARAAAGQDVVPRPWPTRQGSSEATRVPVWTLTQRAGKLFK